MSLDNKPIYTGGCQCGAIRFRVEGALHHASICHCRMCQKAFGSFYAPLANVGESAVHWTRGEPKRFKSSSIATRGFCGDCGTPLTFEADDGMALAIGAFDDPASIMPDKQWGIENKLPYVDDLSRLPGMRTEDDPDVAPLLAEIQSFQHPDHDTNDWPLEPKQ